MDITTEVLKLLNDNNLKRFDFNPLLLSSMGNNYSFDYIFIEKNVIYVIYYDQLNQKPVNKINFNEVDPDEQNFIYNLLLDYGNIKSDVEYN